MEFSKDPATLSKGDHDEETNKLVPFGRPMLEAHFNLRTDLINLNHGSFGTVPKDVMTAHFGYLQEQESFPEIWFRETFYKYQDIARKEIAAFINAPLEEVVLVENASSAINSILNSYPFQKGDKVVVFSSAYRMVTDTLRFIVHATGIEVVELPIPYPLTSENILCELLRDYMQTHTTSVKMCIFSHISSMPTMVEPIEALTRIAKSLQPNCSVIIDGAHAPGILDLNITDHIAAFGADYYTGNCHKWLYCPKGSAFLWTSPAKITDMHPQPTVISSTGWYDYTGRFAYTGTRDYTAFASIPHGLRFIQERLGGLERMRRYGCELICKGSALCVQLWHTGYLVPYSMTQDTFMTNVILPAAIDSEAKAVALQQRLFSEDRISMVLKSVPAADVNSPTHSNGPTSIAGDVFNRKEIFYTRLSAQVYLDLKDFELLALAVVRICAEIA